jgi:arabinan endo-1,5-alpha-L-arabinosidase
VVRDADADAIVVKPSIGYEASQFLFGWNYVDWRDGWPVLVDA